MEAKRILLVEDDLDTRVSIAKVLEMEGYVVDAAKDGEEAFEFVARSGVPDLVLLDMMMPRMNGAAFLWLRARDERLVSVPVIVVTAFDIELPEDVVVLRKPLLLRQLLQMVSRTVGSPHRRKRN